MTLRIKVMTERLRSAFVAAASIAPTRSPKEILTNVKCVAEDQTLTLMATDAEIWLSTDITTYEMDGAGSFLLPVDRFGRIISEFTDDFMEIVVNDSGIVIYGASSKFDLLLAKPEEFPSAPKFDAYDFYKVKTSQWKTILKRCAFAVDVNSNRYALGGVNVEFQGDSFNAVATDGKRLSCNAGTCTASAGLADKIISAIIPQKVVGAMQKCLNGEETSIEITGNRITVETNGTLISATLVEGKYPAWRQVIPKVSDFSRVSISIPTFFQGVRQASVVADSETHALDLHFSDNSLVMKGARQDAGTSRVEMPVVFESDSPIGIRLDGRFLVDFCRVADTNEPAMLHIKDNTQPVLFEAHDGFRYVVMPMASV